MTSIFPQSSLYCKYFVYSVSSSRQLISSGCAVLVSIALDERSDRIARELDASTELQPQHLHPILLIKEQREINVSRG